jgi:hypothetical protein
VRLTHVVDQGALLVPDRIQARPLAQLALQLVELAHRVAARGVALDVPTPLHEGDPGLLDVRDRGDRAPHDQSQRVIDALLVPPFEQPPSCLVERARQPGSRMLIDLVLALVALLCGRHTHSLTR